MGLHNTVTSTLIIVIIIQIIFIMIVPQSSSKEQLCTLLAFGLAGFLLGREYGQYGSIWK